MSGRIKRKYFKTYHDTLDTLQDERSIPVVSEKLQVLPAPIQTRVPLLEPFHTKEDILLCSRVPGSDSLVDIAVKVGEGWSFMHRFFSIACHEDRVRLAGLDANTMEERNVGQLEVVWSPSEGHGIEGHDEGGVAIFFCALEERKSDIIRFGPVGYLDLQHMSLVTENTYQ